MSFAVTYSDQEYSAIADRALEQQHTSMIDRPYRMGANFIAKHKTVTGSTAFSIRFRVQRHSNTTQMDQDGFNPVSLVGQTMHKPGRDTWGQWIRPVLISKREEDEYRGSGKILDLVKERTEDTHEGLMAEFEQQVAAGTTTTMTDLNHLNGLDDTSGFLESSAIGSQTNVIHGWSKATYSALNGAQNDIADLSTDFSANYLLMEDMVNRIKDASDMRAEHVWYWDVVMLNLLSRVQQPQARYGVGGADLGQNTSMSFAGIPILTTNQLPQAGTTTTNDPISAYLIDHSAIKFHGQAGNVFSMIPFRDIGGGHIARAAFLQLHGQLGIDYFRTSGVVWDGLVI